MEMKGGCHLASESGSVGWPSLVPGCQTSSLNCASGVMGSAASAGGFAENNSARVITTGKESPLDLE